MATWRTEPKQCREKGGGHNDVVHSGFSEKGWEGVGRSHSPMGQHSLASAGSSSRGMDVTSAHMGEGEYFPMMDRYRMKRWTRWWGPMLHFQRGMRKQCLQFQSLLRHCINICRCAGGVFPRKSMKHGETFPRRHC
jgi:hypothetical protein